MQIKQVTWQMRYDFSAIMVCEHCGHEGELTTGYNDDFYHNNVIPSMLCKECGKNRDGNQTFREGVNGADTI